MKEHVLNSREAEVLAAAVKFTAIRGRRPRQSREEFSTMEAAEKYAEQFGDGLTMIYAIDDTEASAHIKNA